MDKFMPDKRYIFSLDKWREDPANASLYQNYASIREWAHKANGTEVVSITETMGYAMKHLVERKHCDMWGIEHI